MIKLDVTKNRISTDTSLVILNAFSVSLVVKGDNLHIRSACI